MKTIMIALICSILLLTIGQVLAFNECPNCGMYVNKWTYTYTNWLGWTVRVTTYYCYYCGYYAYYEDILWMRYVADTVMRLMGIPVGGNN